MQGEITVTEILGYLEKDSSFAFELQVFKVLADGMFQSTHGGSYKDPITKKIREYDIRGFRELNDSHYVNLAVECKNFSENTALVIHRCERKMVEAGHDLLVIPSRAGSIPEVPAVDLTNAVALHVPPKLSSYTKGQQTGKAMDLLLRVKDGNNVKIKASDVFDKMSQAVTSAESLAEVVASFVSGKSTQVHAVIPCLVIPNNRLWVIDYASDGSAGAPVKVSRTPYLINHAIQATIAPFQFTHLEIFTLDGLKEFLNTSLSTDLNDCEYFSFNKQNLQINLEQVEANRDQGNRFTMGKIGW